MSERREKLNRLNQRLEFVARFDAWCMEEPPVWKFWAWRKWFQRRPMRTE